MKKHPTNPLVTKLCFVTLLSLAAPLRLPAQTDARPPLEIARAVADKVIRETVFEFRPVLQQPVLGVEVLDFESMYGTQKKAVGYAQSVVISQKDTVVQFGASATGPAKIWLNGRLVGHIRGELQAQPIEIAYNRFAFQDTLHLQLQQGPNSILVKLLARPDGWVFYLRPINAAGEWEKSVQFSVAPPGLATASGSWTFTGPFADATRDLFENEFPPETSLQPFYRHGGKNYIWQLPPQNVLPELVIPETNSYRRESYADWHYANGALMMAFLALSGATGDPAYADFSRHWCDFILAHRDFFQWQYQKHNAFRGSYHRLFRGTMLDDTGAPALGFAEWRLRRPAAADRALLEGIAEYLRKGQLRLPDSTFCRPEPRPFTVWADDLFMSVPFLLRMGIITGDSWYFDDAARQIVQFHRYLFDPDKQLFRHGWFSDTGETSVAFWGRANGWIAWATAEALEKLPRSHPRYPEVLAIFRAFMTGLAQYQGQDGLWHQVLDHPESYEETSCTAMFVLAMARGVRNGWLAEPFRQKALRGWQGIATKIDADGTVHGICRGTGIGFDLDFYFNRQTFDHDPRGLGAVITAGIETAGLPPPRD